MNLIHQRTAETPTSTAGFIAIDGVEICKILERGAANKDHPRIPAGQYSLTHKVIGTSEFDKSFSALIGPSYLGVLWIPGVPRRTNIEVHTANYIEQLLGCLATGLSIGHDTRPKSAAFGDFCVPGGQSSPAYKKLYLAVLPALVAGGTLLTIKDIASAAPMV